MHISKCLLLYPGPIFQISVTPHPLPAVNESCTHQCHRDRKMGIADLLCSAVSKSKMWSPLEYINFKRVRCKRLF